MLTIRGVYDGKTFRALPNEPLPSVDKETAIAIVFLEDTEARIQQGSEQQAQIAKRMRARRDAMAPLTGVNVNDWVEEGRER